MDLSDFFMTKPQADDFIQNLSAFQDSLYTTDFNLEKSLIQHLGMHKKDAFMKLLRENKVEESSNALMQEFLKKIQEAVTSLTLVSLTVAFEPTEETLATLSQWFLFTLKKQVIFDMHVDKSIVAGATITCNGKFKDYSVKKAFDNVVKQVLTPTAQQAAAPTNTIAVPSTHQSAEHITLGR